VNPAHEIDLLSYLQANEPQEFRPSAPGEYRTGSPVISKGKWLWNRGGFGNRTALSCLIKIRGMGFVQAVETVLGSRFSLFSSACKRRETAALFQPYRGCFSKARYQSGGNQKRFMGRHLLRQPVL
jgi:hypothetical protein